MKRFIQPNLSNIPFGAEAEEPSGDQEVRHYDSYLARMAKLDAEAGHSNHRVCGTAGWRLSQRLTVMSVATDQVGFAVRFIALSKLI